MRLAPRLWLAALAAIGFGLTAQEAKAAFIVDGSGEFSGSGATFTGQIVVDFVNNGANTVLLTIDATGATPTSGFIAGFYFNTNYATPTNISGTPVAPLVTTTPTLSATNASGGAIPTNPFKADGAGKSNLFLEFTTSNTDDRFFLGEKFSYNLTATGLTANNFLNALSQDNGSKMPFPIALKIQSLPTGSGSGFFAPVPAPPTVLLIAAGVPALALRRFVRRKKAEA